MANKKFSKQNNEKSPRKPTGSKPAGNPFPINFYWVGVGLCMLFVILVRMRLLSFPFERDEGEYAYMGNLILHGGMPYRDAYNMKLPGTYGMYAIFMGLFGVTPTGVHFGLLVMSLGTILLLFISLKKIFNPSIAVVTVLVFSLLSVTRPFLGFAAHATHFVNFYVALGLFFYSKFLTDRKLLWAALTGLAAGMAFLMKQQAVFFIVFFGIVVVLAELFNRPMNFGKLIFNTLAFSVAVFIPYIIVLQIVYAAHAFDKFWFWTVTYANSYAVGVRDFAGASMLFHFSFDRMWADYPLIWILAPLGLVLLWLSKYSLQQKIFAFLFGLLSFASVCPGFYFREHYFVVLIPALGLLTALSLDYVMSLIEKAWSSPILKVVPFAIVVVMGIVSFNTSKFYYITAPISGLSKWAYGNNPFVEAPEIGAYIKANSNDTDKIAVLGSEPEIFLYANRRSATGYIYVYSMMEEQPDNKKMQQEMIKEIEKSKPKYMVYCNVSTSWLVRPKSPTDVLTWVNTYIPANYELVGLIDLPDDGSSAYYYWGPSAQRKAQFQNFVNVFKRKGT